MEKIEYDFPKKNCYMITLELYELKNICMDMAELGAAYYARRVDPAKDSVSQRAAYKAFGEMRVKRWVSINLVNPIRNGNTIRSKIVYSLTELLAADASERMRGIIHR